LGLHGAILASAAAQGELRGGKSWPAPDARIIIPVEACFGRQIGIVRVVTVKDAPVLPNDGSPGGGSALGMGASGKGAGPDDVAIAGGVGRVASFTENQLGSTVGLAPREVIGGDVLLAFGKTLFRHRELVHQREGFSGMVFLFVGSSALTGGFLPTEPRDSAVASV
jgi:hypothetical protein